MKCPKCETDMVGAARDGHPMVKTRGMLFKGGQLVFICPCCKADVVPTADVLKTLHVTTALFFAGGPPKVDPPRS